MTKLDEEELTQALRKYFTEILSTRQDAVKNTVAEFNHIYHSKDDNSEYEQKITERLAKASKSHKNRSRSIGWTSQTSTPTSRRYMQTRFNTFLKTSQL